MRSQVKEKSVVLISVAVILSALGFMFAVSPSNAPLKIGYVNSQLILAQMPEVQAVQRKLEALQKTWSDSINLMSQQLQDKADSFQKQSTMMTDQAKQQAQQDLQNLQQQIYQYRQDKVGQGGEYDQDRAKLMKPIRDKVVSVIERVAKDKHMQFVLDKNDDLAVILYADKDLDVTYDVLKILNIEGN